MLVYIYFNLHRKLFSIRSMEGPSKGRVVAHAQRVDLKECTFRVSEAGRQRVIKENRKNVHAGVVGHLQGFIGTRINTGASIRDLDKAEGTTVPCTGDSVTYNPYRNPYFVFRGEAETPIHRAVSVSLSLETGVIAATA